MIASLMMYARPELAAAHDRYWAALREALANRGTRSPAQLSNDADALTVWRAPDLVLSQTCGMPYRLWLHDEVSLIGTPDYGVPGCAPGQYRSALVVRADDPRDTLADFATARLAFNAPHSQSGFAAAYAAAQRAGFWFDERVETGAHQASARAVAEGRADIAALDAVTWALIQRYDAFAASLRVLDWTQPTPGLPYIAARTADVPNTRAAVADAISALCDGDRDALMLRGFAQIPKADYLAVPNPPM